MSDTEIDESRENARPRLELSTVQVIASAFAAVSSAVAASTLGVAGTLLGAGMGSVIATVVGATYTHFHATASHRLRGVRSRFQQAPSQPSQLTYQRDTATGQLLVRVGAVAEDTQPWFSWKRFALTSAMVFAVALVAISAIEVTSGRSLPSLVGTSADNRPSVVQGINPGGQQGSATPQEKSEASPEPLTSSTDDDNPADQSGDTNNPATQPSSSPASTAGPTPSPSPSSPSSTGDTTSGSPSGTSSQNPAPAPAPAPSGGAESSG